MGKRSRRRRRELRHLPTDPSPHLATSSTEIGPPLVDALSAVPTGDDRANLNHQQRRATQQGSLTFTQESYIGPLPPPEILVRFNNAHPQGAKMILDEFVAQGAHRRRIENRTNWFNVNSAMLGQVLAFLLLAGLTTGGIYLMRTGVGLGGFGVIATGVVSGLWAIRAGRQAKERDLLAKSPAAQRGKR